jgi:hypothetical protein
MQHKETAMTTMTPRKRATRKPLRIRPELLPGSARYVTLDDDEYVMIPVRDFGDWYEDIEDNAVAEYAKDVPGSAIPLEDVEAEIQRERKGGRR